MTANLFPELPFNLSGEPLDNTLDGEGEARVRALAESEARKAQLTFTCLLCGHAGDDLLLDCEHEEGETHGAIIDGKCGACREGLRLLEIEYDHDLDSQKIQ